MRWCTSRVVDMNRRVVQSKIVRAKAVRFQMVIAARLHSLSLMSERVEAFAATMA